MPAHGVAAERRCGDMGSRAPDYHDVRARDTSCRRARRTVLRWAKSLGSGGTVFDQVQVGAFTCDGRRSKRRIDGKKTFSIRCVDGTRRVRWWIRPFH